MRKTGLILTIAAAPIALAACQQEAAEPAAEPAEVVVPEPLPTVEPAPAPAAEAAPEEGMVEDMDMPAETGDGTEAAQ